MSDKDLPRWFNAIIIGLALLVLVLVSGGLFRGCAVTHVENYELGYKWDARDGSIETLPRSGYIVHAPVIVSIHTIDLRPMQVCISANQRTLNCKLVKFNPEGLDLFISWHGRGDYADNGSASEGGLDDILKAYAYEDAGKSYAFLEIMREMKTEDLEVDGLQPGAAPAVQ